MMNDGQQKDRWLAFVFGLSSFVLYIGIAMKFRTTLVLLAVLAALGGYVWWSGRQQSGASATTGAADIPVLQIDPAGIRAVEVRGEGKQVRVERAASGWQMDAPKPGPADAFRVTDVISGLAKLQATQLITPTG